MDSKPPAEAVTDNRKASRFELTVDGQISVLDYERRTQSIALIHTEVPPPLRGRRFGQALVRAALDTARSEGLRVVPVCPFVKDYMLKHPPSD